MNLKKNWKRFWTLDRHHAAGFTLVELIVVIAILAILAAVAVPAYSGYVTAANKQADLSLISEIEQALLLEYYSNPQQNMVASVVLSKDGADVADSDTFAADAMAAAFGSNWRTAAKLSYGDWGNGIAAMQEALAHFMSVDPDSPLYDVFHGNADISYTDNIPELFDLMEETAIAIANKRESLGSGANMVSKAANTTMGLDAEDFSELWASSAWDSSYLMSGTGAEYSGDTSTYTTDQQLNSAIANAGVIKARNVALATYLQDKGYGEAYDAIANYTYGDSVVPNDAAGVILKSMNEEELTDEEWDFIGNVFPADDTEFQAIAAAIQQYYSEENGQSQAYTDGLAYYAMMSTVDSLKDSTNLDRNNDETWWNDLYSAVDMYSAIANGGVSVNDLDALFSGMTVSDGSVLVMLMVVDGVPTTDVKPVDANP